MRRLVLIILLSISFFALVGCTTAEKKLRDVGNSPLTQKELEKLHSRTRTIKFSSSSGRTGTATYKNDGTSNIQWEGGGREGLWRIKNGKFCTEYPSHGREEKCYPMYQTGNNEYRSFKPDGSYNATRSFTN